MQRSTLVWLALLCVAKPIAAQEAPPIAQAGSAARITAQRASETPKVDGRLDEAIRQSAQWLSDFVQREPHEGQPAMERTEVAVLEVIDARGTFTEASL